MSSLDKNIPEGLRFTILHRAFRHQLDESIRGFDLTGVQFMVLGTLGRMEQEKCGEITQKVLEECTHISHATMTELLRKLEKKGFIAVRASETDRRCKVICGTEKSETLHQKLERSGKEIFDRLCFGLSEREISELLRITDIMLQNAESISGEPEFPPPTERSRQAC